MLLLLLPLRHGQGMLVGRTTRATAATTASASACCGWLRAYSPPCQTARRATTLGCVGAHSGRSSSSAGIRKHQQGLPVAVIGVARPQHRASSVGTIAMVGQSRSRSTDKLRAPELTDRPITPIHPSHAGIIIIPVLLVQLQQQLADATLPVAAAVAGADPHGPGRAASPLRAGHWAGRWVIYR